MRVIADEVLLHRDIRRWPAHHRKVEVVAPQRLHDLLPVADRERDLTFGLWREKAAIMKGMKYLAVLTAPIETRPPLRPEIMSSVCWQSRMAASIRSERRSSSRPASVSTMPSPVRWIRGSSARSCRLRSCSVIAGCVRLRVRRRGRHAAAGRQGRHGAQLAQRQVPEPSST